MTDLQHAPLYADAISFFGVVITHDGQKKPVSDWKERQNTCLSREEVLSLVSGYNALGIACGAISGGLVVFDFDENHSRFYPAWIGMVQSLIGTTLTVQTYKGGIHVYVRCETPCRNEKLAYTMDQHGKRVIAIETRGEGGYVVATGSQGPHGAYTTLHGDYDHIAIVTENELSYLLYSARQLCESPFDDTIDSKRRETAPARDYGESSLIARYNAENTIEGVLEVYGYRRHRTGRYIRPSGENPTVHIENNRSYHHATNDPLCDGFWHTPFSVYCYYGYGGDAKAAVRSYAELIKPNHDPLMRTYDKSIKVDSTDDQHNTIHPLMVFSHDLHKLPPIEPILDGIFVRRGITMAWGPSGVGKSFAMTDWSLRLSTVGWKVLYIAGEGSSGYDIRNQSWYQFQEQNGHQEWPRNEAGRVINYNFMYWTDSVQIIDRATRLAFIEAVRWFAPDLVVFDTLAQCSVGFDPNSQKDMQQWYDALKEVYKALGCGVSFVHHTNKGGEDFSGAQTLYNAADLVIAITQNADGQIEIASRKIKDGMAFQRQRKRLLSIGPSAVMVDSDRVKMITNPCELSELEEKVLTILNLSIYTSHGCTHRQICDETKIPNASVSRVLARLKDAGLIRQGHKRDPYFITNSGRQALEGRYGYQVIDGYSDEPLAPPAVAAKVAEPTERELDKMPQLRLELDQLFESGNYQTLFARLEEIGSPVLTVEYNTMIALCDTDDD